MNKATIDRNQRALLELVAKPGNDVCADCKSRTPRWTSYNLGIFICMACASVHRKLGTHITKVKSVTMDTWTKEQVEVMRQNGNIKSNAFYNPDEQRHPPPTNMIESERDSELEKFIRAKYEFKRFIARVIAPPPTPPSSSTFPSAPPSRAPPPRSATAAPAPLTPSSSAAAAPAPPRSDSLGYRPATAAAVRPSIQASQTSASRSFSQPVPSHMRPNPSAAAGLSFAPSRPQPPPGPQKPNKNPVWDDLISLQGTSSSSSLPLQYQPPQQFTGQPQMMSPTDMFQGAPANQWGSMGMGMGAADSQALMNVNTFGQPSQSHLSPSITGLPPVRQPFADTAAGQQFQASLQTQFNTQFMPQQQQSQSLFQPQAQPPMIQQQSPYGQQPSPFGQQPSPFGQQPSPSFPQQPSPFPQQQQQPMQQQQEYGMQSSPFAQQLSPYGTQSSPFGQQASPYGQQMQQQPQQQNTNPFGQWQQAQPTGYPGQQGQFQGQPWGGM